MKMVVMMMMIQGHSSELIKSIKLNDLIEEYKYHIVAKFIDVHLLTGKIGGTVAQQCYDNLNQFG